MRILLLNPPYFQKFSRPQRSPAVTKSGTLYFPIWLAYAAGVLEQLGHEVHLVDAPARGMTREDAVSYAVNGGFELVVVESSTPSIKNDIAIAEQIRHSKNHVILTGTHATVFAETILKEHEKIDFVAAGEYDETLGELALELTQKRKFRNVPGIWFKKNGKVIFSGERELIGNLDRIPFVSSVYKKHLNYRDYFNPNARYPQLMILAGRGCPNKCSFCVYPAVMFGRKYRKRSIQNIIDEMKYIQTEFPGTAVFFEDDTLTADRERLRKLCEEMIGQNIRLSWSCNSRADLDFETMKIMKHAGCYTLCTGFESGVQHLLDVIHKNITVERMKKFAFDARRARLRVHGCFMFGLPGETLETMQHTLEFAESLPLSSAQFYPIMVYPGTESYDWAVKNNFLSTHDFEQWLTADGLHNCVVNRPDLSSETLVEFCNHARRRFYLRPRYILQTIKMMLTSREDAKKIIKAFLVFIKYLMR